MRMKTVWLTRHGNRIDFVDPKWAENARLPHDPPLSPDGVEQARSTGQALRGAGISLIYTSPFRRCLQTAIEIASILDLRVRIEWGLSEWLNPAWFDAFPELQFVESRESRDPRIDFSHETIVVPEYPESRNRMFQRVAGTARGLADLEFGTALWVGHGASVQGSAAGLLDRPPARAGEVFGSVACCCLARLRETGEEWTLDGGCETDHLSQAVAGDRLI